MVHYFRKSLAVFSVIVLATYGVLLACADYFWGYDYDSSFAPEVFVEDSYAPLFYAPNEVFYGGLRDDDGIQRFNDEVTTEWTTYLKGKMPERQVRFYLLNDSAANAIEDVYAAIGGNVAAAAKYRTINIKDERIKGFFEFLHLAKLIEKSSTTPVYSWNYEESSEVPVVDRAIREEVSKRFLTTKDPFLKNRYWFQAMKACFYGPAKGDVIAYFDKTKSMVPKNTLYYRGLAYVAGAHHTNKNYALANLLYSQVFDQCPKLRYVTANNFHPENQTDIEGALSLARTSDEKAAVWALAGYYMDEVKAIREIYQLNSKSPHLDYLLTRLINKEEAKLNALTFDNAVSLKNMLRKELSQDAYALVDQIAAEGKTTQPQLWNTAAGYLNAFRGEYAKADKFFTSAEQGSDQTALTMQQIKILRLINTLLSLNEMNTSAEQTLLPQLQWLYKGEGGRNELLRVQRAITWSRQYISSLYKEKNNPVMAELFFRDGAYYHVQANVDAMKSFMAAGGKTPWEKMALSIYDFSLGDVNEYEAVLAAYNGKLEQAITFMGQATEQKDVEMPGNPFNGKIKDCHDCDHAATQKIKYTKLSMLQKMLEMQRLVDAGQDVYNNALLLANAYYNITYYGNARAFYYGKIMDQYGNYIAEYYQPKLLGMELSRQYYEKALAAAQNDEQRARCSYMLAKCERNDYYTRTYHYDSSFYGETSVDFLAWVGFQTLKSKYPHTKYYKDVINECGYFRKYAAQR